MAVLQYLDMMSGIHMYLNDENFDIDRAEGLSRNLDIALSINHYCFNCIEHIKLIMKQSFEIILL
jgi:hypothetical protein